MTRTKALYIAVERIVIILASGSVGLIIYAWWRDASPDFSIMLSWPLMLMITLTGFFTFLKHNEDDR